MRFLERFDEAGQMKVLAYGRTAHFKKGVTVLGFQDETKDVYILRTGAARATIYSASGKAVAFRDLYPGDIFGELAAIDNRERSASIVSLNDIQVVMFSKPQFEKALEEDHSFYRAVLEHLSQELRKATARIFEFSTMRMRDRLIAELMRLADTTGLISPAPTHQDLAEHISSHREAVSRQMSELAKAGLISKCDGTLRLPDLELLKKQFLEETTTFF